MTMQANALTNPNDVVYPHVTTAIIIKPDHSDYGGSQYMGKILAEVVSFDKPERGTQIVYNNIGTLLEIEDILESRPARGVFKDDTPMWYKCIAAVVVKKVVS